ncbi:MAG TPA: family 10 glycosylhydrolase [Chryseosolibacter sp.]
MKRCLLLFLPIIAFCVSVYAQAPKREVRGAWIATYANIDWPKIRTEPVPLQRAALVAILDHHKATGVNTIYFQIRSQCDAMYQSNIEPWSADMTGTQGKAPTELSMTEPSGTKVWDPLKFIIDECHKRGMELHAWINPYRAINNFNVINTFAPNHVARQHPEWLLSQGTLRILDPGIPAAQAHIRRVIGDVVSRYDLDGIHFDDYFYPPQAPAGVTPYNDDATFAADPRGFTDRGDWRRDNVSRFIKSVADTLMVLKPWVKFGVSPSGIYRNSTNPAIGSNTSGLQHYVTLFADTRKWLQEGWIDYLAPQVYWYIGQPGANYSVVVPWWNNNAYGRHIYVGLAGYKVNDPLQGANWANPSMIPNEVRLNRNPLYANIYGQAVYNTTSLLNNKLGFRDSLRTNFYKYPALLPRMPWRDDMAPDAATALSGVQHNWDSVSLAWNPPTDVLNEFDKVKQFVIYRSENPVINYSDPANIVAILQAPASAYIDRNLPKDTTYYYAITALDRFHNESSPSNVTDYVAPVISCVPTQQVELSVSCAFTLADYSALATVSDDVSTASEITIAQSPAPGTSIAGTGVTLVTLTATDASGKSSSCSFSVVATDKLAPVVTSAPENIVVKTGNDALECTVAAAWVEPTATDNCTTAMSFSSRTHAPGDSFPVGTTTVTYVFTDESGNATSVSFDVVVEDTTAPVVMTRNITRALTQGIVVITPDDVNNGSWDNCGISSLSISKTTFTCEDIGQHTIILTVIDQYGNQSAASTTVTIEGTVPQPSIEISRSNNVYTGLPANTIALGYGAQSLLLTADTNEEPEGLSYEWSHVPGLSSTSEQSVVFTPTEAGTYIFNVEVINSFGCSSIAETTIQVIDVRCGNKNDKVQVCHTLGEHAVESCVSPAAVPAMLLTGANLGPCSGDETETDPLAGSVLSAYPNPFEDQLNLQFKLPVSDNHVRLVVSDLLGGNMTTVYRGPTEAGQTQTFALTAAGLRGRVFVVRLIASSGKVYYLSVIRR